METEDTEYLINISRDITERKEHERRLQNQNERLERFVSVVSHDLRSPLNVADGYLDLAQNNGHQEHLEKVESALHRMDRIIDDLLYLARKGDDIGDREPVDLDHLVADAWEAVKSESVQATLETDATLPTINADPDRLRQVLENLLRNAIEHGGPGVSITVEPVEDGFAVADDGPGIPPDSKSTIFSAGFSTEEDGTGLGLSIVQEIVNAHDWNISVTTSEAGGARFEITGIKKL